MNLPDRLIALLDHLGLERAHVATQMTGDIAGLAAAHPNRLAGVVLCVPSRLDPTPFAALPGRMLMIAGAHGMTAEITARAAARLPGSRRIVLEDYDAPGWADVVSDRTAEIIGGMSDFFTGLAASTPVNPPAAGVVEGLTYRVIGQGPALLLLPFFLAPSQWDAAIPALSEHFTVIVLGGRHLGGVAALEDRATAPSYRGMVRNLLDIMAPAPGETILDVGCGSGALDRMLAHRFGPANPITATDLNPFLLREAAALAEEEGLAIRFQPANAEALPFPDDSFDHAFTVTVLEECDADKALRELHRVVRPGGRVGVIVRAIDMPQWWNLTLPEPLSRAVTIPPQSIGRTGVADASLYPRMRAAGFTAVTCFPSLVTLDRPDGPIWRYREDHVRSGLTEAETTDWDAATTAARSQDLLFMAHPMHCAVGFTSRR